MLRNGESDAIKTLAARYWINYVGLNINFKGENYKLCLEKDTYYLESLTSEKIYLFELGLSDIMDISKSFCVEYEWAWGV